MLGRKNTKKAASNSNMNTSSSGSTINTIVEDTRIEGNLITESDLRIDGYLHGTIASKGKVIIGEQGKVEGDISCTHAIISGTFDGKIKVSEMLTINESARITGDILTAKLTVNPGAKFDGTCSMGGQVPGDITISKKEKPVKPVS